MHPVIPHGFPPDGIANPRIGIGPDIFTAHIDVPFRIAGRRITPLRGDGFLLGLFLVTVWCLPDALAPVPD